MRLKNYKYANEEKADKEPGTFSVGLLAYRLCEWVEEIKRSGGDPNDVPVIISDYNNEWAINSVFLEHNPFKGNIITSDRNKIVLK